MAILLTIVLILLVIALWIDFGFFKEVCRNYIKQDEHYMIKMCKLLDDNYKKQEDMFIQIQEWIGGKDNGEFQFK